MLVLLTLSVVLVTCSRGSTTPSTIQAPCPVSCTCNLAATPRRVDCSGLELSAFPASLHFSTQLLDLSSNNLTSLPPRLSHVVPQLETLLLNNNDIASLPPEVFRGLQDLRVVDLSHNALVGAPPTKLLSSNPRILELRLSYNTKLHTTGYLHSQYLEHLDFSGCNITKINGSAFIGLPALRILNMSSNPLTNLPLTINSSSLRFLDITRCNLSSLPSTLLMGCPRVQQLQVAGNRQLDLPRNPPLSSRSLLQFTADHCGIQHAILSSLPALTHAYLSCNKITSIRRENFAIHSALLELDLAHNLIRELPKDVFMNAEHLVSVDLSSNHINSLQYDSFSCCHELKFLNLTRNDITSLPDTLTMPSLAVFDLSRCRLAALPSNPDFLNSILELRELYLSYNELQDVPNLVSNTLKVLDLSYCHLTHVTNQTFSKLVNLQRLDLTGNRITTLAAQVFQNNTKLGTLALCNNPWRCNCTDPDFLSLFQLAAQLSETGRNQLVCNDPEDLSGKLWEDACQILIPPDLDDDKNHWLLSLTLFMTMAALGGVLFCTRHLVGNRPKVHRRRRPRPLEQERRHDDSDISDGPIHVHLHEDEQCTPCMERRNRLQQRHILAEAAQQQPPSYEEAVLMPPTSASTASLQVESTDEQQPVLQVEEEEEEEREEEITTDIVAMQQTEL